MLGGIGAGIDRLLTHLGDQRAFQRPFLVLLAIYVVFYFSELANFSLSIDDEHAAAAVYARTWAVQDRWLQYLISEFIVSRPVLPFFPGIIFGLLISAGYLALLRAHGYQAGRRAVMLAFALFAAFPTLFFILDFAVITIGFGVGILLACACVASFGATLNAHLDGRLGRRERLGQFALQAGLAAAAIGAYQSLILLVAVGCCGVFILHYLNRPAISFAAFVRVHVYLALVLAAGMAASFLIARGFQALLGVEPAYIKNFWHLDRLLNEPLAVLEKWGEEYADVYGGAGKVYGSGRRVTFPAILILGGLALVLAARNAGALRRLCAAGYLLGMTAIPFAFNLVANGVLPYRVLVAVPYVFWFFGAAALSSRNRIVSRLAAILVAVIVVQCLHTFSLFQAGKRLVLEHDMEVASEIYDRIAETAPDFSRARTYHVDFYGALSFETVYRRIAGSTISASFFEWDGGNPGRIATFMKILGYANLEPLDDARRKIYLPVMQELPVWPRPGSVKVIDDVVLVRLGEAPGDKHRRLIESE